MAEEKKGNQVVEKPKVLTRAQNLSTLLKDVNVMERFNKMLGKRAAGFVSSITSLASNNKALAECEPMSLISAAAIAASMDLPINQNLGFAWIVPYREKGVPVAQFQMGYKGYIQLAQRSGQYRTMNVGDFKEGQLAHHNQITGEFSIDGEPTSDKSIGYFFYFKLINGFEKALFMSRDEVERHAKKYSKTYQRGIGNWIENFDAMAKKTVIRLCLSRWGILSIDMQEALRVDGSQVIEGGVTSYPDAPEKEALAPGKPGALNRLKGLIAAQETAPVTTGGINDPNGYGRPPHPDSKVLGTQDDLKAAATETVAQEGAP